MAVRKLVLETDPLSCAVIAIHSPLESYRLAYFLNINLGFQLHRATQDITQNNNAFAFYEYFSENEQLQWRLVTNRSFLKQQAVSNTNALFSFETHSTSLVSKHNKVDFFLVSETDSPNISNYINQIRSIELISAAYSIESDNVSTFQNYIF